MAQCWRCKGTKFVHQDAKCYECGGTGVLQKSSFTKESQIEVARFLFNRKHPVTTTVISRHASNEKLSHNNIKESIKNLIKIGYAQESVLDGYKQYALTQIGRSRFQTFLEGGASQ